MKKASVKMTISLVAMFAVLQMGTMAYTGMAVVTENVANSLLGQYGVSFNFTENSNSSEAAVMAGYDENVYMEADPCGFGSNN